MQITRIGSTGRMAILCWLATLLVAASAGSRAFAAEETTNQDRAAKAEKENDKVLRHAVFFKFKDDSSQEDVQRVVEAFRALPGKIKEIRGFQLGENISPQRADGYTHCFFLTFDDEAGREVYLPHPDHKEFGSVLRPHLDKVFVVDYWGRAQKDLPKKPLMHAVFVKFNDDAAEADIKAVEEGLAALPAKIDAIKGFEWGKNNSPEKHDQGFTHCFMFAFESEQGLKEYLEHPEHVDVVKILLPAREKIRVLDFIAE